MKERLTEIMLNNPDAKYRMKYKDYDEFTWTVPLLLTESRIENLCNDHSVDKVEILFSNKNLENLIINF